MSLKVPEILNNLKKTLKNRLEIESEWNKYIAMAKIDLDIVIDIINEIINKVIDEYKAEEKRNK